ncbi:hypothetical protein ACHQM5_021248 [Ranunculus cassubicifolius]
MKVSKSRRRRSCNENEEKGRGDKLSNIPEYILYHILSFLDMKYVIQTSMLSRRWRYLWTSVSYLDFNDRVFVQCLESNTKNYPYRCFTEFVTRVLFFRHSSPIQKFVLSSYYDSCGTFHVDSWIRAAVQRNIQTLDLQFYPKSSLLELPQCLFNCTTLTSLALDFSLGLDEEPKRIVVPLPDSINLTGLRYMLLRSIGMMSTKSIDKVLSGCPVLEKLVIMRCQFVESKCLAISSPRLKHLELDMLEHYYSNPYSWRITVYAPSLISMRCKDFYCHDYSFENISLLETAEMEIEPRMTKVFPDNDDAKHMVKWLKELYNVKVLILNDTFLEAIGNAPEDLKVSVGPFSNLRRLELAAVIDIPHLQVLAYILEKSPNIEVLVVEAIETHRCPGDWGEGLTLQHLVSIKVRGVQGCFGEVDFLKILLEKATALRKMTIFTDEEFLSDINVFTNSLLTCPRASANAKIFVHHTKP